MFRTIVVGWDGSEQARDALALARLIARPSNAKIVAACVYEGAPVVPVANSAGWYDYLREAADETLEQAGPDTDRHAIASSSAARGLHDIAEAERADLVVLGSCHRGPVGRILAGSVGERLLHGAPCAVSVAPRGFADKDEANLGVIAVGYNGEPESDLALQSAAELARAAGASVRLVGIVTPPKALLVPAKPVAFPSAQEILDARREYLQGVLERGVGKLPADANPSASIALGSADALGDQEGIDVIVVGSRGYGPLKRTLLGSTSTALIRHAAYPVIVIPRGTVGDRDNGHPVGQPLSATFERQ